MDFHEMNRRALQLLCKKHNIRANGTNLEMADQLTSLLKNSVLERKRENESSKVMKKVRFCVEEENVVDTPVRMTRSRKGIDLVVFSPLPNAKKKTKRGRKKDGDTSTAVVLSESVSEAPVRMTRSRRGTDLVDLSPSPVARKKTKGGRKKDGVEDTSTAVILSESVSEAPVRMTRSRRGTDLVDLSPSPVAKKKTKGGGNNSTALVLVDNDISGSSAIKEDSVRVTRSLRSKGILLEGVDLNLKKKDTSSRKRTREVREEQQNEVEVGDVAMKNTRQTRSRKKDNELVNNVSNNEIVKRSKRVGSSPGKSVRIDGKKVKEATSAVQIVNRESKSVPKPENAPRRSKRNAITEEDAVQSRTKGVIEKKVSLTVVGESENASKLEQAPRRSRRSSATIQLSGVTGNHKPGKSSSKIEKLPRMSIVRASKCKSMASTNVGVEQPVRRCRQNSTNVKNVALTDVAVGNEEDGRNSMVPEQRVRASGKSKSSVSKSYSILEELPRRSTRGAFRRESIAVDSMVAVSSDLKCPNIPEDGRAAQKKGKTTSGGRGEPKPRAKTSSGKRGQGKTVSKQTEQKSDLQEVTEDVDVDDELVPVMGIKSSVLDSELIEGHMKLDLQVNTTSEQVSQLVDSTVLEGKVTVDDSLVITEEESSHIVNEVESVLTGGKLKTQFGSNISNHTEGSTRAASVVGLFKDVGEHVGFQEAQPESISCVHTAVPKAFDIAGEISHTVMDFQVQEEDALPLSTEESVAVAAEATSQKCNVSEMDEPLMLLEKADGETEKDNVMEDTILVEEIRYQDPEERPGDHVRALGTDTDKFKELVKVAPMEEPLDRHHLIGGGKLEKDVVLVDTTLVEVTTNVEQEEYLDDNVTASQACHPSLDDIMNVAADRESVDFENKADFVEEGNEKDTMPEVLEVPVNLRKDASLELLALVNTVTEDQISKVGDPLEERTVMNTISDSKEGGIVAEDENAGTAPLTQVYTQSNVENVEDEEENLDCAFENIGGVVESEESLQQVPKEVLELKQGEEEKIDKRCNVELDDNIFRTDSFFSHSVESVSKDELKARTSPLLSEKDAINSGLISGKFVVMEEENSGSHLSQSFQQNTVKEASCEDSFHNDIDSNSVQESWKTVGEAVEYHTQEHADPEKELDLEMHDPVDVVSGERDYKADQIFMTKQSMTAEREKAGKDDSDLDELVEEYPVLQGTHKILLEDCETEKNIQVNSESTSGKICGEKSDNTAYVSVGENKDTECLPFVALEEHPGPTEAFIAEGNLWGDGAYSEQTCKHVDGNLGTTHQILEELSDQENYVVNADGEDNSCFVPTPEILSYEFCQDEKEDIQVNSNHQIELGDIRGGLPETAAVSSSYCSENPLANVAMCQGDVEAKSDTTAYELSPWEVELFSGDNTANEDAAIFQNRTCREILEPKEMSEAVREDKGSVDPTNDTIRCNKQEQEDHIDSATVSLPPDQVEDDGDGLEVKRVLFPKDFSNSFPSVNMTRDNDSTESFSKMIFDVEEAEVPGAMLESTAKSHMVENKACIMPSRLQQ